MNILHRVRAWRELLRRYADIFRHYWKQRHAMRTDFFNKAEAEFLPAGLSLQEAPGSASLKWTARILMAIVVFTLMWSIFGRMDIIVTGTGKIIPSARTKTIASVDVASVRSLHVTEGQTVRAGDLLIELDSSSSDAERDKAVDSIAQARLQVARSQAMIRATTNLQPPRLEQTTDFTRTQREAADQQLSGQYRDFAAKLGRLDGEITRYAAELPLATRRADDYQSMLPDHTVSQHAWLEREQAKVALQGQLADAKNQRTALIAQTRKEALDAITDGSKIIAASSQDQHRAGERSRLLRLVAPVDGTVQQLTTHTVGGVVPAAQPLMQIVPRDSVIEIEAFLENKDIGFVNVGQKAKAKIDAYDYTKYGTIGASVRHVSRDAIEDEKKGLIYATRIALDRSEMVVDGKTLPVTAGMSVNVEILTGTRRVIEYVLSPLLRHQKEALRER